MTEIPLRNKLLAEVVGTFCLVFAGTSAAVVNQLHGSVTHVGVSLVFGLIVFAMIAAIGDVSGSHINPAVTLAFAVARRFSWLQVVPYIVSQCLGAIAASVVVHFLFPTNAGLGGTLPVGAAYQSWVLEFLLTAMLMFVVLGVSSGAKEKGITAGIAIGGVVALEALFAGPVCGASMNPARSLGPALISGQWHSLWIYLTAPVAGAVAAVPLNRILRGPEPDSK